MVNDDVRDRILAQLEDRGVDDRIGEEVVPTPPEHLLDRDRQVGVRDVEEWAWVVNTLNTGTMDTATGLSEAHSARGARADPEGSSNKAHEMTSSGGLPCAAGVIMRSDG